MEFQEFLHEVKGEIEKRLDKEYSVSYNHVIKNNGIELDGLIIFKENVTVVPNIYVNEYYELYQRNGDMNYIVDKIMAMYNVALTSDFANTLNLEYTFETMKDKIYYRIVNFEKNIKILGDIPHKKFLDMAIIFYCLIDTSGEGIASIRITNDHIDNWGISSSELLDIAMVNTPILFPGVIRSMKDVIKDLILKNSIGSIIEGGDEIEDILRENENVYYFNKTDRLDANTIDEMLNQLTYDNNCEMYVLTNSLGINGASAILYNGLIEEFANKTKSNLYILPSSIHEVIIMPYVDEYDIEELKQMVREINATQVPRGDVLSDSVYVYQRKECAISI